MLPPLPKTDVSLEQKLEKVTIKQRDETRPKIINAAVSEAQVIEENFRRVDDDYWFCIFENQLNLRFLCVFFILILFVNDSIKD